MIKIAVVTGCAGFIGSSFTERLLQEGWYVYGIDKYTYVANRDFIYDMLMQYDKTFKFKEADIATLERLPECDVIFNFAAESDVDNSNKNCASFVQSNVQGVQNLLSLVTNSINIRNSRPLFFQISTDEVYGDIEKGTHSETSILNPSNPYSATKAAADLLIQSWSRTHKLEYCIVRPSNNYGTRQYPEKLIPLTIKNLIRNKLIKLHNNGNPIRTWTHVEDTINAILLIFHKGSSNAIYNISSQYEKTNKETVQTIINSYCSTEKNIKDYIDDNYSRPGQDIRYAISCEPLNKLNWQCVKDFDTEIHTLIKEAKEKFIW